MTANVYNSVLPPVVGVNYTFIFPLLSQADTKIFKASPTLAAGDFILFRKASGSWSRIGNLTTLPALVSGSTRVLEFTVLAAEIPAGTQAIGILCNDVAGAEWCDLLVVRDVEAAAAVGTSDYSGTGTGATATAITVNDGTNPIDGAQVYVATDSAFGNVIASGVTNTSGVVTFYLDAGTYYVRMQAAGYNFADQTLVVT